MITRKLSILFDEERRAELDSWTARGVTAMAFHSGGKVSPVKQEFALKYYSNKQLKLQHGSCIMCMVLAGAAPDWPWGGGPSPPPSAGALSVGGHGNEWPRKQMRLRRCLACHFGMNCMCVMMRCSSSRRQSTQPGFREPGFPSAHPCTATLRKTSLPTLRPLLCSGVHVPPFNNSPSPVGGALYHLLLQGWLDQLARSCAYHRHQHHDQHCKHTSEMMRA